MSPLMMSGLSGDALEPTLMPDGVEPEATPELTPTPEPELTPTPEPKLMPKKEPEFTPKKELEPTLKKEPELPPPEDDGMGEE